MQGYVISRIIGELQNLTAPLNVRTQMAGHIAEYSKLLEVFREVKGQYKGRHRFIYLTVRCRRGSIELKKFVTMVQILAKKPYIDRYWYVFEAKATNEAEAEQSLGFHCHFIFNYPGHYYNQQVQNNIRTYFGKVAPDPHACFMDNIGLDFVGDKISYMLGGKNPEKLLAASFDPYFRSYHHLQPYYSNKEGFFFECNEHRTKMVEPVLKDVPASERKRFYGMTCAWDYGADDVHSSGAVPEEHPSVVLFASNQKRMDDHFKDLEPCTVNNSLLLDSPTPPRVKRVSRDKLGKYLGSISRSPPTETINLFDD